MKHKLPSPSLSAPDDRLPLFPDSFLSGVALRLTVLSSSETSGSTGPFDVSFVRDGSLRSAQAQRITANGDTRQPRQQSPGAAKNHSFHYAPRGLAHLHSAIPCSIFWRNILSRRASIS